MSKKLVITADDFGISREANIAILKGLQEGLLTGTCIMANGDAFDHAIQEILPQYPEISLGIHLNIIEGKSLRTPNEDSLLCDGNGNYNNGFVGLLNKSLDKVFLAEVEADFRSQIEKILEHTEVFHINSHVHTHVIPGIFKIVCKLAKEYGIKYIRTQNEIPYVVPSLGKHLEARYPVNLVKSAVLNTFSYVNKKTLEEYELMTNDYFVGVSYTGYMDENTIRCGIKAVKDDNVEVEAILHPTIDANKKDNYQEFLSITNLEFKNEILASDWDLTNHRAILGLK